LVTQWALTGTTSAQGTVTAVLSVQEFTEAVGLLEGGLNVTHTDTLGGVRLVEASSRSSVREGRTAVSIIE
jgi:hypothetical protein